MHSAFFRRLGLILICPILYPNMLSHPVFQASQIPARFIDSELEFFRKKLNPFLLRVQFYLRKIRKTMSLRVKMIVKEKKTI